MAGFLAGVTVVVHFAALIYIGFGGFLAWRWPKAIIPHLFLAAWGVAVNVFPIPCPLTAAEDYFRGLQGLGPLPGGFNAYYIYGTLIPDHLLGLATVIALTCLVVSYAGAFVFWRRRRAGTTEDAPPPAQARLG
ncbi:hypothetical protein CFN78_19805 [Amycolatopsis antarctica]|uniref:DUF2784 domain-containing protein n=1 Tax=Amycolatopsis antarctica TaxID=1854586 RepID=A0A263CZV0_9PSEU|nr:DUF2784 domain-containing protein [Amycolatopsis antarctica]OZM71408.1 hypothetical protein CFN78_19805 [Amycolatopsis antarctica]